jgi:hypothetical protein
MVEPAISVCPAVSSPPHRDSLRHQNFEISLERVGAIHAGRHKREILRGCLSYWHRRRCGWDQRARCRCVYVQSIHGQHSGADRCGHPSSAGRIEISAARGSAKSLRLAAVPARCEPLPAPKANAVVESFRHVDRKALSIASMRAGYAPRPAIRFGAE